MNENRNEPQADSASYQTTATTTSDPLQQPQQPEQQPQQPEQQAGTNTGERKQKEEETTTTGEGYAAQSEPVFYRNEGPTCYEGDKSNDPSLMWSPSIEPIIFPAEYRPPSTLEDALKETPLSKEAAAELVRSCASKPEEMSPYLWLLTTNKTFRSMFTEHLMMPCNLERLPWKGLLYNTLTALRSLQQAFGTFYCVEPKQKTIRNRTVTWNSFLYVTDTPDVFAVKDLDTSHTVYVLEGSWGYFVGPSLFIMEPGSTFYVSDISTNRNTSTVYLTMSQYEATYSIFQAVVPLNGEKQQAAAQPENAPLPPIKQSYLYQELLNVCEFINKSFDYKNREHIALLDTLVKKSTAFITNRDFCKTIVTTIASTVKNIPTIARLSELKIFDYLSYLLNLYSNDLSLRDPILDLMKLISLVEYRVKYENSNYYTEKTSILFKFFCESLEDPKALRYFVKIFENFVLNYQFAEKLAETNIVDVICGFLHDRYDAISICNYLSDFLVYLFKASNVFQQHLKTLKHTQICVIIEIFSKIEYLETRTFDNILSLITLIPVTEENSFLFVGTLGIILNSIRNEQLTSEATIDTFKTIAMFLKFPDLADSFLENEGLEVVLNQLYEWGYTEQISQHAMMIFMYLSYDKSTMEFMIQNRLVETVTGLMRNHTSNQSICESGLTFLRNALRQRETKFTAIQQKDVVVVAKVFEANMQNPVVCKKACCIIQNLAFSLGSKNAITKQAPNIVRLILEALKLHYQKSKSLCVDAMSALRNFAAGEFVFSLLPLLPPKEIISIIIEITRMYHSDQRVCACACGLLWNLFSAVDYGKEFYTQGGIEELVGLIKEYSFTGVVCENTAGALKNLKSFEPAKERIKTLFVEDNELSALLSGMNE